MIMSDDTFNQVSRKKEFSKDLELGIIMARFYQNFLIKTIVKRFDDILKNIKPTKKSSYDRYEIDIIYDRYDYTALPRPPYIKVTSLEKVNDNYIVDYITEEYDGSNTLDEMSIGFLEELGLENLTITYFKKNKEVTTYEIYYED